MTFDQLFSNQQTSRPPEAGTLSRIVKEVCSYHLWSVQNTACNPSNRSPYGLSPTFQPKGDPKLDQKESPPPQFHRQPHPFLRGPTPATGATTRIWSGQASSGSKPPPSPLRWGLGVNLQATSCSRICKLAVFGILKKRIMFANILHRKLPMNVHAAPMFTILRKVNKTPSVIYNVSFSDKYLAAKQIWCPIPYFGEKVNNPVPTHTAVFVFFFEKQKERKSPARGFKRSMRAGAAPPPHQLRPRPVPGVGDAPSPPSPLLPPCASSQVLRPSIRLLPPYSRS